MPISIFKVGPNTLQNITASLDLDKTHGWWNTVIATDVDSDGDQDFLIGNLGENYKFRASKEKPFYIFADDFDQNGTNDIFLAKTIDSTLVPIRGKECSSQQIPNLKRKFRTYESFAHADLPSILGEGISKATQYKAYLFSSIILENQQGKLILKKMPKEAQFSTIHGIVSNDYNDDGQQDILVVGNNFDVEIETTRSDASPGFVFFGKPDKTFDVLQPQKSGIFVPYNVKDVKEIKLASGETGVLITTNNGILRFFKNKIKSKINNL